MSQLLKNILIVLTVLILLALGFYMLKERGATESSKFNTDVISEQLLSRTQFFIEKRNQLDALSFDDEIFTNPTFSSLISYSTAVPEQPVGVANIFE